MKTRGKDLQHLETRLAGVLHYGTCLASALIGLGLVLMLVFGRTGDHHPAGPLAVIANHLIRAGIAVFILLPVVRVGVMFTIFLRRRDYRFVAIAALVLLIILVSVLFGVLGSHGPTLG